MRPRWIKKGLHIKARIDRPEPGTFLADIYRKIKSGTIRGLSIGGKFFRRIAADGGPTRIYKADIFEISATPQPVNARTLFAVGTKAFADEVTIEDRLARVEAIFTVAEVRSAARSLSR